MAVYPILWGLTLTLSLTLAAPIEDWVKKIEEEAGKLTELVVSDDQRLVLEVSGDHSIYRHTSTEKRGAPVWVRKGSDDGKGVVVLKEGEDFLPKCGPSKKTFVVLKQNGDNKKEYVAFLAYVRSIEGNTTIEWDAWFPRGNSYNKASIFGFVTCSKSNMLPCKKELQVEVDDSPDYEDFLLEGKEAPKVIMPPLPYVHPQTTVNPEGGSDYWCDIGIVHDNQRRYIGTTVTAFIQAMTVLTGAEIVYKDEQQMLQNMEEELQKIAESKGGKLNISKNATVNAAAAEKMIEMGRSTVAGGTLMFYSSVIKLGALAVNETHPLERIPPMNTESKEYEELCQGYKAIGMNILRGLFRGTDIEDADQPFASPNPQGLMNENTVASLVAGKNVGEALADNAQQGRVLQWLLGKADIGTSSSNGEQAIRQYKGVIKDGSVTGSRAIDQLNFAIDNAFGGTKKSSGQVFTENLVSGLYAPYGFFVEDIADAIGGSVFGIGKISNDKTYFDDLLDKTVNVVAGAAGQVVDVVGDILGPIGLGGLWTGIAGVTAAGAGGFATVVTGPATYPIWGIYTGIKMAAKGLGFGGVLGMHDAGKKRANDGNGNYNQNRYSAPNEKTNAEKGREQVYGKAASAGENQFQGAPVAPTDATYAYPPGYPAPPPYDPSGAAYPPPPPAGDSSGAYGAAYPPAPPDGSYPPPPPAPGGSSWGAAMGRRRKRQAAGYTTALEKKYKDVVAITNIDIFSHVGWRTMDVKQTELASANLDQANPFVGFGNCVYKPVTEKDWKAVQNGRDAALLYFRTLRTQCLKDQVDAFKALIQTKLVKYNEADRTFDIPDGRTMLTFPKISPEQVNKLGKAFEMVVYSKVYQKIGDLKWEAGDISKNAATFRELVLVYLDTAAKRAPLHYVKLTRNIAKLAKTAFTKSLEDFIRYKHCRKCTKREPMTVALKDSTLYISLVKFILKEQENPDYKGLTKEAAFYKYAANAGTEVTKHMWLYMV